MQRLVVITDWEQDSLYRTIFEGALFSKHNQIQLSYINIKTNKLFEAALVLRFCVLNYPANTFFFVGVKTVTSKQNGYLYLNISDKHVFLPNNGILGLCNDILKKDNIFSLPYETSPFPEIDIFLPAFSYFIANGNFNNYALSVDNYEKITNIIPDIQKNKIIGSVIYIDIYGNAITNITYEVFNERIQNKSFVIYPGTKMLSIYKIAASYSEIEDNKPFAIFNTIGLLEIGIINNSISELYNLQYLSNITIEIYDT